MQHLFRKIAPGYIAAYCGTLTLTGYNMFTLTQPQKKYPARDVDNWHGSCPPFIEYRSKKLFID
jgi:hypothetical protein